MKGIEVLESQCCDANVGYSCVVLSYAIQKHQQEMIYRWWFQSEKNHPYLGKIPNLTI